jgi:PadR family transcriptional regulator, regulatory protein PadR
VPRRITNQLLALLEALMADFDREWYGLELMEATNLSSGTLYPLLHRLVADGWLERTREVPSEDGGRSRRLYKVTGQGALSAGRILSERADRKTAALRPRWSPPEVQPA